VYDNIYRELNYQRKRRNSQQEVVIDPIRKAVDTIITKYSQLSPIQRTHPKTSVPDQEKEGKKVSEDMYTKQRRKMFFCAAIGTPY
jgi:hypothetical protein